MRPSTKVPSTSSSAGRSFIFEPLGEFSTFALAVFPGEEVTEAVCLGSVPEMHCSIITHRHHTWVVTHGQDTCAKKRKSGPLPLPPSFVGRRKKRSRGFLLCSLPFAPPPRQLANSCYWLSGFRAMQTSWAPGAEPSALKRTTASSIEQKLRLPVWLTTKGTAVASYCTLPAPLGATAKL